MSKRSQVRADGSAGSRAGMSRRAFLATGGVALLGTMVFASPCYGGGLLGGLIDAVTKGSGSSAASSSAAASAATSVATPATVEVKASTNDYTWDELAAIADEISASGSADAALQVAMKYSLCTPDGRLDGTQVKLLELSDGMQTSVQIAGFYHDDKSDGTGKAGITFIFSDAVAKHAMNSNDAETGGWQASELRSWLSSDLLPMLPADLVPDIVTVDKLTNNIGGTSDIASVTATPDALWAFSMTELCGEVELDDLYDPAYNAIMNAEGTQYQLFSDCGFTEYEKNDALLRNFQGDTCTWWTRSPRPGGQNYFYDVYMVEYPFDFCRAAYDDGVVPGFCVGTSNAEGGAAAAAPVVAVGSVAAKSSVNDYTWDELKTISGEISAAQDATSALQVAEKYNLCTPDGKLDGTQVKSVTLSDGTQAEVQIAGFYHDDKSDGSGKAGITFIFKDAVAEHEMNPSTAADLYGTNSGGWEASEMRSWLSSDFMSTLPSDLAKDIVTVDKLTNNTGETSDVSSVTATQDAVWLFSSTELCRSTSWYASTGDDAAYDAVLNAEGTEYQLFSDSGVSSIDVSAILAKNYQGGACYWWARSACPYSSDSFNNVRFGVHPLYYDFAGFPNGVVPGFCI